MTTRQRMNLALLCFLVTFPIAVVGALVSDASSTWAYVLMAPFLAVSAVGVSIVWAVLLRDAWRGLRS